MRRRLLLGLISVLVLLTACGTRWYPAKPRVVRLGAADLAFEAALVTLDGDGYRVAGRDPARGLIVAKSKVDQKDSYYSSSVRPDYRNDDDERVSWIALQIYSDGSLHATAWGHLVKQDRGVMHRKLAAEIDLLLEHIVHHAKAIYRARYGSPDAQPYPAPAR